MKLADFIIPLKLISSLYHTSEANLVPIARIHIASFTSMFFSAKYLTGHRYFIHKTGVLLLVKKINTRLVFMYYSNGKKRTKWYAMASHVIAYRSKELLFGTHAYNFNCFLDDFNCVLTQICCLSVLLVLNTQTTKKVKQKILTICIL